MIITNIFYQPMKNKQNNLDNTLSGNQYFDNTGRDTADIIDIEYDLCLISRRSIVVVSPYGYTTVMSFVYWIQSQVPVTHYLDLLQVSVPKDKMRF